MKSIIFGSSLVGFWDSVYISVVSMLIVFFVLIFISYILSLLKYLPQEQKKREERIEKITDLNHLPQKKISAEDYEKFMREMLHATRRTRRKVFGKAATFTEQFHAINKSKNLMNSKTKD